MGGCGLGLGGCHGHHSGQVVQVYTTTITILREEGTEGGRERGREKGREEGREGGKEGGRKGGRETCMGYNTIASRMQASGKRRRILHRRPRLCIVPIH